MDIKIKKRGTLSIFTTLFVIIICGLLITTLGLNYNMKKLEDNRLKFLDSRESAKEWVTQEVINFISVVDKETWEKYRVSSNLDEYARNQMYGTNYEGFNLSGAQQYMIIDSQYTVDENEDLYKIYVDTLIQFEGVKRELVFIATIRENKITNMVVY